MKGETERGKAKEIERELKIKRELKRKRGWKINREWKRKKHFRESKKTQMKLPDLQCIFSKVIPLY